MTVASIAHPLQYTGNGSTVAFAWTYQYTTAADLWVLLWNTTTQTGVASVLNGNGSYDYTVTNGSADAVTGEYQSATVTFNTAPPSTYTVTIGRAIPPLQSLVLSANGALPAVSLAVALDRMVMALQDQANNAIDQTGTATLVNGAVTVTFPTAFANQCLSVVATQTALTGAGQAVAIGAATPSRTAVTFYGPPNSTATFNWRAKGW